MRGRESPYFWVLILGSIVVKGHEVYPPTPPPPPILVYPKQVRQTWVGNTYQFNKEYCSNSIDIFMPDRAILSLFKMPQSTADGKKFHRIRCPPKIHQIFSSSGGALHMLKYLFVLVSRGCVMKVPDKSWVSRVSNTIVKVIFIPGQKD